MKYLVSILAAALLTAVCCTIGTAQTASEENQPWHFTFKADLEKIANSNGTDGLGYNTLTEEEALAQAVENAISNGAPAWQVLKVAVGMNFNPYSVLSAIFKSSEDVDLGQLYTYATETGGSDLLLSELNLDDIPIDKTVMQQAVNDALSAGLLTQNEVSKVQQLIDQGLAFTEPITPIERNDPAESNTDYSP